MTSYKLIISKEKYIYYSYDNTSIINLKEKNFLLIIYISPSLNISNQDTRQRFQPSKKSFVCMSDQRMKENKAL